MHGAYSAVDGELVGAPVDALGVILDSACQLPLELEQAPPMSSHNTSYVPASHGQSWETIRPDAAGFDAGRLEAAVAFAGTAESPWPRSFYHSDGRYVGIVEWNETGPWSEVAGFTRVRGGPAGLVMKGGRIVTQWGDPNRADMTFSVAKSFISMCAGLAVADGLIPSLDEPVARSVKSPLFEGPHNSLITWRHLLQQSSEWQGMLFEKSDQVDHNRNLDGQNARKGEKRELKKPGSYYEYNDVRVNVLALALLHRFGRPLPEVLRERVMNPIGASAEWEWHGYRTSWVDIGGKRLQSVSGGAHWGGGLFISAFDLARVGLLFARGGTWGGKQILPASWIKESLTPSPTNANYGLMWWLNTGRKQHPALPEEAYFALGAGNNMIVVLPKHDIVTVFRWLDKSKAGAMFERLVAAVKA